MQPNKPPTPKTSTPTFIIKYVLLTTLVYAMLIATSFTIISGHFFISTAATILALLLIGGIYSTLARQLDSLGITSQSAEMLTILTLFPPIIGPMTVFAYVLSRSSSS